MTAKIHYFRGQPVKPGDNITVRTISGLRIFTVQRLTATQAVCENDFRFRLVDGRMVGSNYSGSLSKPEEIERLALSRRIAAARIAIEKAGVNARNIDLAEEFVAKLAKLEGKN